jgi:hypothetical protein
MGKRKPEVVILHNNKGEELRLPGNLTLKDLAKLGVRKIKFEERGAPVPDGWWTAPSMEQCVKENLCG